MIYFFSDPHFNHKNIIKYCMRPFMNKQEREQMDAVCSDSSWKASEWKSQAVKAIKISDDSVEKMNTTIIDNINAVVGPKDELWCLGDFSFNRDVQKFVDRIICKNINLIWGNHDRRSIAPSFRQTHDLHEITVRDRGEKQRIVLCHYSMRVWNKSHRGSWHLYGHSHGTLPDDPHSLSFDIGVDCWDFKPLSYDKVKEVMSKKERSL